MKRKLEQLNLLDDFLFGSVLSYPEIGEDFCRTILRILLKVDIENIRVVPQKIYYGTDTDLHGTRLDVYIEEDGGASTVYDVEPDKNDSDKMKKALPRRVRYYHSKIDSRSLKSGDDYSKLKQVVVLMILSYDPFGKDRILYTIQSKCKEEPDMEYDDGAATFFFYTKGKKGNVSEKARKLLKYMEDSTPENADCEWLQELHWMVERVRHDEEVSLEYMKVYEREQMIREQGEKIGEARGEARGKVLENVAIIRNMKKAMPADQTAAVTGLDKAYVERIYTLFEKYQGESTEQIAERLLSRQTGA